MIATPSMNFAPPNGSRADWLLDGGLRASPSSRHSSVGRGGVFIQHKAGEHRTSNIERRTSKESSKTNPFDVRCWEFDVGCFPLSVWRFTMRGQAACSFEQPVGPRVVSTRSVPLDTATRNTLTPSCHSTRCERDLLVRCFNARPHPNPLPQVEGTSLDALFQCDSCHDKSRLVIRHETANVSPSPGGEGRGEGRRCHTHSIDTFGSASTISTTP